MSATKRILAGVFGLLVAGGSAYACTLERIMTVAEGLQQADAVFVGMVEDVRDQVEGSPDPRQYLRRARLRVREVWRGPRREYLTVWTLPSEGNCGVPFRPGKLFLVFAGGKADRLATSLLLPTKVLTKGDDLPDALGPSWHNPRWDLSDAARPWETPQNNQMQLTRSARGEAGSRRPRS